MFIKINSFITEKIGKQNISRYIWPDKSYCPSKIYTRHPSFIHLDEIKAI